MPVPPKQKMRRKSRNAGVVMHARIFSFLALATAALSGAAWACSSCVKDIVPRAEFDETAWEQSDAVFIATIVAAHLGDDSESSYMRNIEYDLELVEVLKGEFVDDLRIWSSKSFYDWSDDEIIVGCGDVVVGPGDRLLVFWSGETEIYIGRCSATRTVDFSDMDDRETILRLRDWSRQ